MIDDLFLKRKVTCRSKSDTIAQQLNVPDDSTHNRVKCNFQTD